MKITLERSGGFMGVPMTTTIDTATLSPSDAERLQQILGAIDFPKVLNNSAPANQPDRFQYRLTLEDTNGQSQTLSFDEATLPSDMQPLIDWLRRSAR